MAMAMALRRAGRAGAVMRGLEWCNNGIGIGARSMATAARVEDNGPSASSSGRALGSFSALLGAGALYASCQRTVLLPAVEFQFALFFRRECFLNPGLANSLMLIRILFLI